MNKGRSAVSRLDDGPEFLRGGGAMGELLRTKDWSATPLGPPPRWPQSLRAALGLCLGSGFPIAIYWGPQLLLLYNDAWSAIAGARHPAVLGRPAREVWSEIWHIIAPLFAQVMTSGQATRSQDQLLPVHRHGYTEECYFDYTFSPIRGENGEVAGVFNAVVETTYRVVGERRMRLLRRLAESTATARSAEEACQRAAATLHGVPEDAPFCLFYLAGADGAAHVRLAAAAGVDPGGPAAPAVIDAGSAAVPAAWPLARAAVCRSKLIVDDLIERFDFSLAGRAWPEPVTSAAVVPIPDTAGAGAWAGFMVVGISPRRRLDEEYENFIEAAASQVGIAVATARAHEAERRRAAQLAALDRAKTEFFSNVSHELRTPLTLMMGPLEEALRADAGALAAPLRASLRMAHRNSVRLLKLVNSLLDFSRIEAGRADARYEPTPLGELTAGLASVFRAAVEQAGMRLRVDCPALPQPVYVDRDMWEKIVLNLVSNAIKYTFAGEIRVRLHAAGDCAELSVADTGTGIPPEALPHLFERFYRVPNARGRTHEGTGIGLALVHELVRLHGGSIRVDSEIGKGTTFTVSIPFGSAHLPPARVRPPQPAATAAAASAYLEEVRGWLPELAGGETAAVPASAAQSPAAPARILLADDNADMREYVRGLLAPAYDVTAVSDGREALRAVAAHKPDLVVTDVMMPDVDGFGLLQALRRDPATASIPVIMLSARAGEVARIDGLDHGADDYLIKPFSARELYARVTATLARARREADERMLRTLESMTDGFVTLDREWRYSYLNAEAERLLGRQRAQLLGKCVWEEFPELAGTEIGAQLRHAVAAQRAGVFEGFYPAWNRWYECKAYPTPEGGAAVYFRDISERKRAESELHFQATVLRQVNDAVIAVDGEQRVTYMNSAAERQYRVAAADALGRPLGEVYQYRWDKPHEEAAAYAALADTGFWRGENMHVRGDGTVLAVESAVNVLTDETGRPRGMLAVIRDVTARKAMEARLRASEERFRHVSDSGLISIAFFNVDGEIVDANDAFLDLVGYSREELRNGEVRWDRLTPPEWMPRTRAAVEEFHATGRISPYEKEYSRRDGSRFWGLFGGARFGETSGGVAFVMDITERKQAEEARRQSEALLATKLAMMKRLHALSTRLLRSPDLKTVLEEVLEAALALTGTDMGSVQLIDAQGRAPEIVAQRGFRRDFLDHFRTVAADHGFACARALHRGKRTVVEDVENDPDFAPYRDVAVSAGFRALQSTPLLGRDGKVLGVLSTHFRQPRRLSESEERMLDLYARHAADFIERFRIEQELRASEERLRFALRSANAGAWRFDVATGESFWSEEFMALYGYQAATPRSYRAWLASVHVEDRERVEAEFRRRRDSQATEFQQEFRIVHPERGVRWILDLGRVVRDTQGRALSFSGINLDITERKQAEQALRDSERLYRAIGESINYGVWICDPEGRNIYVSESFLRLVGLSQEQCSAFGWSQALHPDDAEHTVAAWKECVRTGGHWDIEHRYRGVDGKWHPVLARGMAVRNERGEITAWAGINLDISRQKQVEDELREAHYRKDEFLATLAHELRNPLAPLRNGLEILRLAKDNRDAAERARGMMERQLQQMVRLIDDLLDLSRISRGKVALRKERIDLVVAMQQAVETSRPLIEQAGHELAIEVPAEPVYLDADVTRLSQVFANLLNNAARYTERGGRIALTVERRDGEAVVRVRDNGRGIPAHMLARVFEMFTQVERPPASTHGGLGIGLSIVQRLVEMHRGSVEAYSDGPGMGSEFVVRLPVVASLVEEAQPPSGDPPARLGGGGRRVLVADDNADSAASLATMLKVMGNDVRTACDGLEAVEVARLFQPELVLLDIGMPQLDGYEACRRMRAHTWGRGAVIAALTGWGQEEDRRRSREAGFDRHLVKPVEPAVLEELLAALPQRSVA